MKARVLMDCPGCPHGGHYGGCQNLIGSGADVYICPCKTSTLSKRVVEYWDFIEVQTEVNRRSGRDTRNWAGKEWGRDDPTPYLDFWHFVMDSFAGNGSYATINFEEWAQDIREDKDSKYLWAAEVCDLFAEIVGPGEHCFFVEW